jgi:hypothetical protein
MPKPNPSPAQSRQRVLAYAMRHAASAQANMAKARGNPMGADLSKADTRLLFEFERQLDAMQHLLVHAMWKGPYRGY